jgi:hypothetical protein
MTPTTIKADSRMVINGLLRPSKVVEQAMTSCDAELRRAVRVSAAPTGKGGRG